MNKVFVYIYIYIYIYILILGEGIAPPICVYIYIYIHMCWGKGLPTESDHSRTQRLDASDLTRSGKLFSWFIVKFQFLLRN